MDYVTKIHDDIRLLINSSLRTKEGRKEADSIRDFIDEELFSNEDYFSKFDMYELGKTLGFLHATILDYSFNYP